MKRDMKHSPPLKLRVILWPRNDFQTRKCFDGKSLLAIGCIMEGVAAGVQWNEHSHTLTFPQLIGKYILSHPLRTGRTGPAKNSAVLYPGRSEADKAVLPGNYNNSIEEWNSRDNMTALS
jgi:hypothetical protein